MSAVKQNPLQTLAFVSSAERAQQLGQLLAHVSAVEANCQVGGIKAAVAYCRNNPSPELLMVDISQEAEPLAAFDELADVCEPQSKVVALGELDSMELYRDLTALGVSDYLLYPLTGDMVSQVIARILGGNNLATRLGKTVAVLGCSGGVGTSTIAANLGWYLAREEQVSTAVCDYDLYTGDIDVLLNAEPNSHFRVLLRDAQHMDELLLERSLVSCGERLSLLKAVGPVGNAQRLDIDHKALAQVNRLIKEHYNYSVWDVPARGLYSEEGQSLLLGADTVVMVLGNHLHSIRQLNYSLQFFHNSPDKKIVLVLNHVHHEKYSNIQLEQLEKLLGRKIDVVLSHQPQQVKKAAETGTPVIEAESSGQWHTLMQSILGKRRQQQPSVWQKLLRRG